MFYFKDRITSPKLTFIIVKDKKTFKHKSVRILPVYFGHQPLYLTNIEDKAITKPTSVNSINTPNFSLTPYSEILQ